MNSTVQERIERGSWTIEMTFDNGEIVTTTADALYQIGPAIVAKMAEVRSEPFDRGDLVSIAIT